MPDDFRFSVKLPKTITHQAKLSGCTDLIETFVEQAHALGDKLAIILVQLPPKLSLDEALARRFFADLHDRTSARLACEPRNASWFTNDADALLAYLQVARVAADPALSAVAAQPGGWRGLSYWRLHGSPVMYRSSYSDRIGAYADKVLSSAAGEREAWCIFDNTASSAAAGDALALAAAALPQQKSS